MPTPRRKSPATSPFPSSKKRSRAPSTLGDIPETDSLQVENLPKTPSNRNSEVSTQELTNVSPFTASPGARLSQQTDSPLAYAFTPGSNQPSTGRSHYGRTPNKRRADLAGIRTPGRQFDISLSGIEVLDHTMSSDVSASDPSATGANLVIWGTDVVIAETKRKFTRFIKEFKDLSLDAAIDGFNPEEPLYMQKLSEIAITDNAFIDVDCGHLEMFDRNLNRQLRCYPQEVIPTFDMAVNEVFTGKYPNAALEHQIMVRTFNKERTNQMRQLNPEDIDQLVTISGMVIRTSSLIPEMREAFFKCTVCAHTENVEIDRGRITEPTACQNCNTGYGMTLIHNLSLFNDKQVIKLQESPDDMPAGQTPHTIQMFAHSDMVDKVQPGDRVLATGIYRATPLRINPRQRNVKSVYRTHIDIIHFRLTRGTKLRSSEESEKPQFTEERIQMLKRIAKSHENDFEALKRTLSSALAPNIYENQDIKFGILCQLFGGTRKDLTKSGRGKVRSEINILLCGDPGTSKSQILTYVHRLLPRSQYTSGKGSSAVGLTATITKDPETRQLVLQTGALVLSDNGICCIDEFDKMNDNTRSILHEVMEQQTLSIAKAGIICSLNARTSILAAANPVDSRWNSKKSILDNIKLPHTLLSRFDLIFLILDPQNEEYDRHLARHLVSLYDKSQEDIQGEEFDMDVLRDYVSYARAYLSPTLSDEASQRLIEIYVEMRKVGSGRGMVTAYPRQLESLIRLSEAIAKMRFVETVVLDDVEEAYSVYRAALKQAAVDPVTGEIDINQIYEGQTSSEKKRRAELVEELRNALRQRKGISVKRSVMFEELNAKREKEFLRKDFFNSALKVLEDEDSIKLIGDSIRIIM